jgi:hypothetical protein
MNLPFEISSRKMDSREAADTGLLLWRECFISFLPFFAIPFWLCAFILRLLPGNMQYFSWLILWFLKPLFDRPVLHIISVRFFESVTGMKRLFKGLGKSLWRGLPGDLLWRRFSPFRAAMMPVRVLEYGGPLKKSANEITKRKDLLKKSGIGYCFFLTLWGIALEIALLTGEIFFFGIMADLFSIDVWPFSGDFSKNTEVFIFAAWCFNYMFVETLYVCMGFSLYINSRIDVEGWDIEIMFRNFAKRLNKKTSGVLAVIFLVCLFVPVNAFTEDLVFEDSPEKNIPMEKLQEILASPDFGGETDSWGIKFKEKQDDREFNFNTTLEKLRFIFASALRIIIIICITVAAVLIIIFVRKLVYNKKPETEESKMTILHGIPLGNPELILQKAMDFHAQKNLRMAWGYCTAAAILSWTVYRGLVFPPGATENECANLAGSIPSCNSSDVHVFNKLINNWINFAYAGQLPPEGSFEEAAAFCKSMRASNG